MGETENTEDMPLVTVVIPVLNETRTIDGTMEAVLDQSYPNLEIVVVDGESDDGTLDKLAVWLERDSRLRVVSNPRKAIPPALNIGLDSARGKYLVRVDAHSAIPRDYVTRLVATLEAGEFAGVGGRKTAVGSPPAGNVIAAVLGSPIGVGGSSYHYATEPMETDHIPFGAYRVDVARDLEGWDERLVANEDFEFDVRVRASGGKLFLDPSVEIRWQCRSRILDFARQYRRYGRGKADVAFLHPSEVRLRHMAPPILVAGLAGSLVLLVVSPIPLAAAVGGYGLLLLAMSVPIARSLSRWSEKVRVPAALAAMQLAWGWGVWEGLFRIARNGFALPPPSASDSTRWGSPKWTVKGQNPRK